ncbi:MAG: nucleotide exchange factor GrpE [Pseudomonadota bacterium]
MTDSDENASPEGTEAPDAASEHEEAAGAETPFGDEHAGGDAEARIDVLEAEAADLKDRLMRAVADAENLRRRTEREKSDTAKYAIANFARDLLSVADNMQRALDAMPEDELENASDAIKGLITGVRMTERELLSCFERNGVRRIAPAGEKFDPNVHQAIAEVPGNGEPAGVVVDVAQTGFVIADRVLRAAMVTVSSGAGARDGGAGGGDAEDGAASPETDEPQEPGGSIDTTA